MKHLRITVDGKSYDVQVELLGEESTAVQPLIGTPVRAASVAAPAAAPAPTAPVATPSGDGGALLSPLSAVVVSVEVAVGQTVTAGQPVLTLEAMKMNTVVSATQAGTVKSIAVKAGDAVDEGQELLVIA
ncbi:biotin carboxyl carrier protein [Haloferula luteola]|uniref:Biotin carboxyl carrier protein n=1 Tax=Haloferula luteola TaxID=595692 RepID=A0A840VCX3_9BACT|nr:biotin/lipoyl-containing protein [Haloferula luteola]MBB5352478.1 biotin carboxyl carrier protein [Haloferula luteola]